MLCASAYLTKICPYLGSILEFSEDFKGEGYRAGVTKKLQTLISTVDCASAWTGTFSTLTHVNFATCSKRFIVPEEMDNTGVT